MTDTDGTLKVEFDWSEGEVGAPPRYYRHMHEHVSLARDQWMQVRYNGRHQYYEAGWYYEKHVLNIGFVDALVPSMFVAGHPDYQITDFADLF
jgi:hypothetical protein